MAFSLGPIGGDKSETHSQVERILRDRYEYASGLHKVTLHYTSGRGYQVLKAVRKGMAVAKIGPEDVTPKPEPDTDIKSEVEGLLREKGLPVY